MIMQTKLYLRNKIKRQIDWNGQEFTFTRYKKDKYGQITEEVELELSVKGVYHDGGGYGGMLNIEIYSRDGSRTITKMKPMIICLYEEENRVLLDDVVHIGDNIYKVVEKVNVKNMNVAFEISLEVVDGNKH